MNSAAYLGDANGKDGMRATARVIHGCGACGSMGIAKCHKIIHVSVVVNQAFRQICTQSNACVFFDFFFAEKQCLTLNIWAVQRVLSHSQRSVPICRFLFQKIVHTLIIDLQIAGIKTQTKMLYFANTATI